MPEPCCGRAWKSPDPISERSRRMSPSGHLHATRRSFLPSNVSEEGIATEPTTRDCYARRSTQKPNAGRPAEARCEENEQRLARPARIELAAPRLGGGCSIR